MSLLDMFFRKKEKTDDVQLIISRNEIQALQTAFNARISSIETAHEAKLDQKIATFEARLSGMQMNLDKINGEYGQKIQSLKAEKLELEEELQAQGEHIEVLEGQVKEAQDIEAKRKRLAELAPAALEQIGYSPEKAQGGASILANPQVQDMVDQFLEEQFPDIPVTMEGLLRIAPMIIGFMQKAGLGAPAQKKEDPKAAAPQVLKGFDD